MKKALSSLLALAMILTIIQVGMISASALQDGDFTYTVTGTNATITAYTGAGGAVTIPGTLNGGQYTVVAIGTNAFLNKTAITSFTIPSSVTSIGSYAFRGCTGITSITIPSSVTAISTYTFQDCTGLTGVTIPSSIISIGNYAFKGCSALVTIAIPNSVTSIGTNVFRGCSSLTGITIPASVTSVGASAFYLCSALTGAYFLSNAPSLGASAFYGCAASFTVYYNNSSTGFTNPWNGYTTAVFIPTLSQSPTSLTTDNVTVTITYPNVASVKEYKIGTGDWTAYTAPVSLSNNFTVYARCSDANGNQSPQSSIAVSNIIRPSDYTYTVASNQATITRYTGQGGIVNVPDTLGGYPVTEIGEDAFWNCTGVTTLNIQSNTILTIGESAFKGCTGMTSINIGNGVQSIGGFAFYNCTALTGVTLPNSVTDIGEYLFYNCTNMTTVTLGNGLISISDCAFFGCTGLTSITIPNSVTSLGNNVFLACTGLTGTGTIPSSVTSMGTNPFMMCTGITQISVDANNPNFSSQDGVLYNKSKTTLIEYPSGKTGSFEIPSSVTIINTYSFFNCSNLQGVTLLTGLLHIYDFAFIGCTGLTSISFPSSLQSIGEEAFSGCSGLTSLTIPNITISRQAFEECTGLTSIAIQGTGSIVDREFWGCTSLTNIPSNISSIGEEAFYGCTGLTNITIGNDVRSIGRSAFQNCSGLTGAYFLGNAPTIDTDVFSNCASTFKVYYLSDKTGFTNPWNGYTTQTFTLATIAARSGSTTVIDRKDHFIYGLKAAMTSTDFENNYVQISGSGHLVYTYNTTTFGTGTKVDVIDDTTNSISETFYIVIFGDVNSDGNIDIIDSDICVDVENGFITWSPTTQAYYFKAADVNLDDNIDSTDGELIEDVMNYINGIDQTTGMAYVLPTLSALSTTVINQPYIYGLEPGISQTDFLQNYIQVNENGTLVCTPTALGFGTGTKIELIDNITNKVTKTYYIVIFGDVNGDGNVDSTDAQEVSDYSTGLITWSTLEQTYKRKAANINLDSYVNQTDGNLILDYENGLGDINQQTGLYTAF